MKKKTYRVKNSSHKYDALKTEKQWAASGYIPYEDATGTLMWVNGLHLNKARYYAPHEVRRVAVKDYIQLKRQLNNHVSTVDEIEKLVKTTQCSERIKNKIITIIQEHLGE